MSPGLVLSLISAITSAQAAMVQVEVRLTGTQGRCEKLFTPDPAQRGAYTLQSRHLSIDTQLQPVKVLQAPMFMGGLIRSTIEGAMASHFPGGRLTSTLTAVPGRDSHGHDRLMVTAAADGTRTYTAMGAESIANLAENTVTGQGPALRFTTDQCVARNHSISCAADGTLATGSDADAFWDAINRSLSEAILRRILTTAMAQHAPAGSRFHLQFQWRKRSEPRLIERPDGAIELHGPLYDVAITITVEK